MTDRAYPSSKSAPTGNKPPAFPATKGQQYSASRPTYRPAAPQHPRRGRRSCCCCCIFWVILIIVTLLVLTAIAGAIVYFIYRPHLPSFSVTSLKLSHLKITASSTINSKFDVNISATNPNKKITFYFDPASLSILYNDASVGDGDIPSFLIDRKNTTLLKASAVSNGAQVLDGGAATDFKTNLKSKSGVALQVRLDTKVKAKMAGLKTPKLGVRVSCDGITVAGPTEKAAVMASTMNAMCEVDVRLNIWKWTI